jgi:hypothetical protein
VGVANTGYVPGRVNLSVRLARRNPVSANTNLIALLGEYASRTGSLREKLLEGDGARDFARGHRGASGGSLDANVWEEFVRDGLEILERPVAGGCKEEEGKEEESEDYARQVLYTESEERYLRVLDTSRHK